MLGLSIYSNLDHIAEWYKKSMQEIIIYLESNIRLVCYRIS